jgi:hypothetical protein
MADRSRTSAEASLSRDSPSSIVTLRGDAPSRLTIEVATASVGLTMAPRAMAVARSIPGISHRKSRPSSTELITTSVTDRPPMAVKSRRKSIDGRPTAAE